MKAQLFRLFSAVLLLLLGAYELSLAQQPEAGAGPRQEGGRLETAYRGGLVTPPVPKPKFTLTDTLGKPFDFWSETDGYITLLFFGYTRCTSVCPLQMSYLAGALHKMPKDVASRFKVVFVTTDPTRDNPQRLRTWLNQFDKNFIGLAGTEAGIEAAEVAAHVPVSNGNPDGHAAFVFAYTKDNLAHVIYPAGVSEADWVHDLPQLVKESWTEK